MNFSTNERVSGEWTNFCPRSKKSKTKGWVNLFLQCDRFFVESWRGKGGNWEMGVAVMTRSKGEHVARHATLEQNVVAID